MTTPRQRLLDAAVDYVSANGVTDISLRQLAAALGTSHRMLIYHFGSKEGLFVAVVREVERRQRETLAELERDLDAGQPPAEFARRLWHRLADPAMWPLERLFFEIYAQALRGEPSAAPLLGDLVDPWVRPSAELATRHGLPPDAARAHARLGVAVVRGLLLDLLATGDRDGATAAMEAFLATYRSGWPESATAPEDRPA